MQVLAPNVESGGPGDRGIPRNPSKVVAPSSVVKDAPTARLVVVKLVTASLPKTTNFPVLGNRNWTQSVGLVLGVRLTLPAVA